MNNKECFKHDIITMITTFQILFLIFKWTNVINWSWWAVLIPFYGPICLFLVTLIISLICLKINKKIHKNN